MTVNSSIAPFSQIDDILLDSFKKAGLVPLEFAIGGDANWNAKSAHGRRILNRIVENLANEGFLDQFEGTEIVQLTAGTSLYALDPDILNLVDNGSNIPTSNGSEVILTNSETPVLPMSRFEWNTLSNKSSEGTPTRYFLDRNGPDNLQVYIWPVPSENSKIRFMTHRIPSSSLVGSNTVDLKRHWDAYLVHAVAYELATDAKLPLDERAMLKADRDGLMMKIKTYETHNEPPDVQLVHSSPWAYGGWR